MDDGDMTIGDFVRGMAKDGSWVPVPGTDSEASYQGEIEEAEGGLVVPEPFAQSRLDALLAPPIRFGDVPARILASLQRSMASNDIVFSFGGIGATPDDHTRRIAAQAAGLAYERHPQALLALPQSPLGRAGLRHVAGDAEHELRRAVGAELRHQPFDADRIEHEAHSQQHRPVGTQQHTARYRL